MGGIRGGVEEGRDRRVKRGIGGGRIGWVMKKWEWECEGRM